MCFSALGCINNPHFLSSYYHLLLSKIVEINQTWPIFDNWTSVCVCVFVRLCAMVFFWGLRLQLLLHVVPRASVHIFNWFPYCWRGPTLKLSRLIMYVAIYLNLLDTWTWRFRLFFCFMCWGCVCTNWFWMKREGKLIFSGGLGKIVFWCTLFCLNNSIDQK